jgi:hypothetical protein
LIRNSKNPPVTSSKPGIKLSYMDNNIYISNVMEELSKVKAPDMLPLECAQEPAKSKIQIVMDAGQTIDGHIAIPVQVISRLSDVVPVA